MLVWQLFAFPAIMNRFGPTNTIRVATVSPIAKPFVAVWLAIPGLVHEVDACMRLPLLSDHVVLQVMAIPALITYPLLSKLKLESLVVPTLVVAVWRNICSVSTSVDIQKSATCSVHFEPTL